MKKDKNKTRVQFLINDKNVDILKSEDCYAFFPNENYNQTPGLKMSYSHIGQHSACSNFYAQESRPAKIKEYLPLLYELTMLGYNLDIINDPGMIIESNQYGFPCKTYYFIVNEKGETYHYSDKKWRYNSLKELTTFYFTSKESAQHHLETLQKEAFKEVKCESGITGWENYLKGVYATKEEFFEYNEIYGIAKRLGYNDPEECWQANPLIQGSTNPSDLKKSVTENKKNTYKKGTHF